MSVAVRAGADRQEMHEVLREHSLRAWAALQNDERNPLVELVASDERILRYLAEPQIRAAMQFEHYVGNAPERAHALAQQIKTMLEQ